MNVFKASGIPQISPAKVDVTSIPKLTVETINNHIYFYADVDGDRCLAMIRAIRDLDAVLRNERITRDLPDETAQTPIWLHIQSYGGYLFTGLSVSDQIKEIKSPIYSIVEGVCASAATLISMACTKRYILKRSFMLIHQLSTFTGGTYEQIKDDVKMMDMAMNQLTDFYSKHSKLGIEQVKEMLKHDTWLDAEQCLERGLVDGIKTV